MMSRSEIHNLSSLSSEARQAVAGAFDALSHWRDEIYSANDRCLSKTLDGMAAAHRAMGWPEHVTAAMKESLMKAAKAETHMIDEVMDAWEQRLKSPSASEFHMPASFNLPFADPMSEMMRIGEMTLVPFRVWMEAAEAWQRNWTAAMLGPGRLPQRAPGGRPRELEAGSSRATN